MHHISPKGDQLCPLGFHPQVRWPTRCKRCFRDYKEHGSKRNGEDIAASTPSLSFSRRDSRDDPLKLPARSWTSSTNLSATNSDNIIPKQRPSSWTSTPDLDDLDKNSNNKAEVSVSLSLPKRRHTANLDIPNIEPVTSTVTIKKPPLPPKETPKEKDKTENIIILKTDSLAERVRKMQLIKRQSSIERELKNNKKEEK